MKKNLSRKGFLGLSVFAGASFLVGGCVTKPSPRRIPANAKVNVGIIGGKLVVPDCLAKFTEADLTVSDRKLYAPKDGHWHEADFIDGILENRQCCSPCEVGHRTISMAHLANVCEQLRVDRLGWDPVAEKFTGPNAAAAEEMCKVTYDNGWELGA